MIAVAPESGGSLTAQCWVVYDWLPEKRPSLLFLIDELFKSAGLPPAKMLCHAENNTSRGNYSRMRRKVDSIFATVSDDKLPNLRVRSEESAHIIGFFPAEFEVELGSVSQGKCNLLVGASRQLIQREEQSPEAKSIAKSIFSSLGPAYAAEFEFPADFGPTAYLWGVIGIPKGGSSLAERDYGARLTVWRDRYERGPIGMMRLGYLREVYPVNYVLPAHLRQELSGVPLEHYMTDVGQISECDYCPGLYRWDVEEARLEEVRETMEGSGLILSAPNTVPRALG